jgi:mono/diheme cytochrome c family protein
MRYTKSQQAAGFVMAVAVAAILLFSVARIGQDAGGAGTHQTPAERGAAVFAGNCADCHYTDSRETKIGPGLAGLFQRDGLPVSGRAPTAEHVRNQIRNPYENMPAFPGLSGDEVDGVIAYLKTL